MLNNIRSGSVFAAFLLGLGIVGTLGCGPEPSSTVSSSSSSSGGGGEGGSGLASLDVLVSDLGSFPIPTPIPVSPNVRVLFNPPGGGAQQEAISDATGHVHFDGIDWSKGNGALTAIGDGTRAIYTILDIHPDNIAKIGNSIVPASIAGKADVYLYTLNKNFGGKRVALSGQLLNATVGGVVYVSPTIPGVAALPAQGTYEVQVQPDTPFSLIALDRVYQVGTKAIEATTSVWSQFDMAALSATTTMDLDLNAGKPLTPALVSGKIELPGGANGPFSAATQASVSVQSATSAVLSGLSRKLQLDPGGATWSYELEYLDLPGQDFFRQATIVLPLGNRSDTTRYGAPLAGEVFSEFVAPPVIKGHGSLLTEPILVEPVSDATIRINAADPSTNELVWYIDTLDSGATSMTVPQLPDTDMAKLPAKLNTQLISLGFAGYDAKRDLFLQVGLAKAFAVKK